jgi:hypothetical protein
MSENERDAFIGTEISKPVPSEDTLCSNYDVLSIWGDGPEERLRLGSHISVEDHFGTLVQNTEIHRSCVKIDTTVMAMLSGVESHEVSSLMMGPELRAQSGYYPVLRWGPQ